MSDEPTLLSERVSTRRWVIGTEPKSTLITDPSALNVTLAVASVGVATHQLSRRRREAGSALAACDGDQ